MAVVAGLGVLTTVTATGETPLDGGRLVATIGGTLVVVGSLVADRDGRGVGLRTLAPRRPRAPLAGWLLVVGPLAVSRPLLGPATSLVTDPFVRRAPSGVFFPGGWCVVSLVGLGALALLTVGGICLLEGPGGADGVTSTD